jgi:DNA-binding NtrC family response regulator
VVDDDAMIVQTGKEMLELLGYRVTTRADGLEALETVRREPGSFHLVITDFVMPRMNGLELAREVMRLRPDLPVILFTGCGKGITARKAREAGLADYLIKPLRIGEIRRAIRRALDAKQPGETAGSA